MIKDSFKISPNRPKNKTFHIGIAGSMFVVLLLALLAVIFLRSNNLQMTNLRDKLVEADQSDNIAKVKIQAYDLQKYVLNHMNTSTGKVALQTLYDQAVERVVKDSRPPNIDTELYSRATVECESRLTSSGYTAWADCVSQKVGVNGNFKAVDRLNLPDTDLYYVEYISPRFSLDLAGLTILLAILGAVILLFKLLIILAVYLYSKKTKAKF